ncbi:hypothetical protein NCAST_30_00250 [Nocardia asteroides NBRC 15531]|uniref:Uncharacterized protein n=1 Tax=Nocardia asteroides NBRC 15531 TaxID=1110697 RepID=U5ED49_NOCAS|nr:hypothetical protein NCAST_30_00250 [Nocardia asteroides NBRC 15531]
MPVTDRGRPFSDPAFARFLALVDGLSPESYALLTGFAERLRAVEGIPFDPLVD